MFVYTCTARSGGRRGAVLVVGRAARRTTEGDAVKAAQMLAYLSHESERASERERERERRAYAAGCANVKGRRNTITIRIRAQNGVRKTGKEQESTGESEGGQLTDVHIDKHPETPAAVSSSAAAAPTVAIKVRPIAKNSFLPLYVFSGSHANSAARPYKVYTNPSPKVSAHP
jgi:hypothetical protein